MKRIITIVLLTLAASFILEAQTPAWESAVRLYGYKNDNGTLLNIGISTNRYYAGATFQSGWQGVNTFLINVGYFFKPCGERPAHPERPKRDPDREYLWGH